MASILPARGTCEKTERGFCSSSRYREKTSLGFFKIRFILPRIRFERRRTEQAKMGDFLKKWEKWFFFFGRAVFRTPPEVVSGFRGGGGGSTGLWG
jgi:hypothetical protein